MIGPSFESVAVGFALLTVTLALYSVSPPSLSLIFPLTVRLPESVVGQLSLAGDPHALRLGDEVRPLTALWDGLECYAAHGDEPEPKTLATIATRQLGRPPDRFGLVDHDAIGDAWERAGGGVSIVALLLAQLDA